MNTDQLVFDFELKIHPKYLDANIQKHIEDAVRNLKDRGIFNKMSITNIRNINLKCIKITEDHIVNLKIEADYVNLKVGKIYKGKTTHVITNLKLVVNIASTITVSINYKPNYKVNDIVKVEISEIKLDTNIACLGKLIN
jgi:exoribonuclease II